MPCLFSLPQNHTNNSPNAVPAHTRIRFHVSPLKAAQYNKLSAAHRETSKHRGAQSNSLTLHGNVHLSTELSESATAKEWYPYPSQDASGAHTLQSCTQCENAQPTERMNSHLNPSSSSSSSEYHVTSDESLSLSPPALPTSSFVFLLVFFFGNLSATALAKFAPQTTTPKLKSSASSNDGSRLIPCTLAPSGSATGHDASKHSFLLLFFSSRLFGGALSSSPPPAQKSSSFSLRCFSPSSSSSSSATKNGSYHKTELPIPTNKLCLGK